MENNEIVENRQDDLQNFLEENKDDLIKEFINLHLNEFNEFINKEIIDENRTYDYWKVIFCNEELEDDFIEYGLKEFEEFIEIEEFIEMGVN